MRKISLLLAVGLIITAAMFIRCTKEKGSTPLSQVTSGALSDAQVEAKIKAFNEKMQATPKSDETMTVDDAVWTVEAALNYNYCRTGMPRENLFVDSIFVSIPVAGNLIGFSDAADAYQQGVTKLLSLLKSDALNPVVVDVKPLTQAGNMFNLKITFVISDKKEPNASKDVEYHTAADQIEYWINWNMQVFDYYTDVETIYDLPDNYSYCVNPNWDNTPNYYQYLMFYNFYWYGHSNNFHEYLSTAEITFYKNGTRTYMNTYTTSNGPRPTGKVAISVEIWGDMISSQPDYEIMHRGNFTYGIPHSLPPDN